MLDYAMVGGTMVDGSGAPARRADVEMSDGRIVAIGSLEADAKQTLDATGKVVTPGWCPVPGESSQGDPRQRSQAS